MRIPGPLVVCSERRRTFSAEARAMRMEDEPNLEQRFDAIVVGTGPGGATVARELTRRGRRVLILERGAARPFTGSKVQTLQELWRPGRSLLFGERLLAVLRAITLGGSSLYFWGTAWDPPRALFARHGVVFGDELDEATRELGIAPIPPEQMGITARRIMDAAMALGHDWELLPKYPPGWSAREWVSEAVSRGATLMTGARVMRVLTKRGDAYAVEFLSRGRRRIARGQKVILAAGGIGSPAILHASGLREAGHSLFCDPLVAVVGELPGPEHAKEQPMTAGALSQDEGFMLADMWLPQWTFSILAAEVGRVDWLSRYPHAAMVMVKIRDEMEGGVTRSEHVRKGLTGSDRRKLAIGTERAREILRKAGARHLFTTATFAAHPGGSAAIGQVVDSDLQTRMRNLYVCDASVIPEPWGLPPSLTVMSLGKRLAAQLTARIPERRPPIWAVPSAEGGEASP